MNIFETMLTAVALSADALALACSVGLASRAADIKKRAVFSAVVFAAFSAAGHIAGQLLAMVFSEAYHRFAKWAAAALFAVIGASMIFEAVKQLRVKVSEMSDVDYDFYSNKRILLLALAAAPDEFAAGVSMGAAGATVWISAATVTAVTFAFTLLGVTLANRIGLRIGAAAGIFGGAIVIGMALSTAIAG